MLYCRFCQDLNVLRKNFWETFPEKLPSEVSITNLMLNWDKLQLSWNNIDVLGCILPNKANEIAILNSRRFIQRPIEHWDSVYKWDVFLFLFPSVFICLLSSEILSTRTRWNVLLFLFASAFIYWAVEFCLQGPGDNVLFLFASIFECDISS